MAISLSEFFFPQRRVTTPVPPPPRRAPRGYSQARAQPSLGQQIGEGFGRFVMRGGPVGAVLDWATRQTQKDIEEAWEIKLGKKEEWTFYPIRFIKSPLGSTWKTFKKYAIKEPLKNLAWGVVKSVSAERDRRAWGEIISVERVWEPIPPEELARFEGSLERMRALGEISLDDATKREILDFLRNPRDNFYLYQAFENRVRLGTMDEHLYREVYNLFRAHEFRPIADDPLRRQLTGIFEKSGEISEDLWGQLKRLGDEGLIHPDVLDFLRQKLERDQFFAGVRDSLAWAHELWSGKWQREVWKRARPWRRVEKPYRAPARRLLGRVGQQIAPGAAQALRRTAARLVQTARQVVRPVVRAAVTTARRIITKIGGQALLTALSSAVGGVIGSLAGPVGTMVGFVAAPIATKLTKWTLQLACLGCGCASVGFVVLIALIVMAVGGAFQPGSGGGGLPGVTSAVVVEKTANPSSISVGPNQEVTFTITVRNNSGQEVSNLKVVDDYDQANISSLSVLGGGRDDGDKWTFEDPVTVIPPGASAAVSYRAWIIADADKTVVNNVTFTGAIAGVPVSASGSAFVIVGSGGEGRPPSEWPVAHGRISQGPFADDSHRSSPAVDIAPLNAGVPGDAVKATHDGLAFAYYNGSGPYPVLGNYVVIESPRGFKSFYGHLETIAIPQRAGGYEVAPGQVMGAMGSSGSSSNVHLHYEFRGLPMAPPYIPATIGPCVGTAACDYEF